MGVFYFQQQSQSSTSVACLRSALSDTLPSNWRVEQPAWLDPECAWRTNCKRSAVLFITMWWLVDRLCYANMFVPSSQPLGPETFDCCFGFQIKKERMSCFLCFKQVWAEYQHCNKLATATRGKDTQIDHLNRQWSLLCSKNEQLIYHPGLIFNAW